MAEKEGTGSLELVDSPNSVQPTEATRRTETESTTPREVEVVDLLLDSNSQEIKPRIKPKRVGRYGHQGNLGKKRGPYQAASDIKSNQVGIKRTVRAMNLALKGATNTEIAEITKIPVPTIQHITSGLSGLVNQLNKAKDYREIRKDLLDVVHGEILESMLSPEKKEKATINQLAYASSEVHKQSRLEHGLSTANNAVRFTKVDPKYSQS